MRPKGKSLNLKSCLYFDKHNCTKFEQIHWPILYAAIAFHPKIPFRFQRVDFLLKRLKMVRNFKTKCN